jgi:hypothetical protein
MAVWENEKEDICLEVHSTLSSVSQICSTNSESFYKFIILIIMTHLARPGDCSSRPPLRPPDMLVASLVS